MDEPRTSRPIASQQIASRPIADELLLTDTPRRLKKWVIKLRWMGMEEEAGRLQRSLCPTWPADGAFACKPERH